MGELFDLYDASGQPLGLAKERALVHRDGDWHRSIHLWIVRTGGGLIFQRRSAAKDTWPNRLAVSVGGHYAAGEGLLEVLREAREEIGLEAAHIEPLGYLEPYLTGTMFKIIPVVALVTPPFTLTIDPREVEAVFETPLAFLMEPRNHQRHAREWQGAMRHYYAMTHEEHYIWGATAGILRRLYERVFA